MEILGPADIGAPQVPDLKDLEKRMAGALQSGKSPLRDKALAPLIRASPLFFAQMCLKGPSHAPFYGRLLFSAAQMEWETIFTKQRRFCILASRGSGKTQICTILHALWRCATEPEGSGYIFSGTEFAAQRILEEIKHEIENNPKLGWLFPGSKSRKWTATQIRTSNGHHLVAKGMLTRVRGAHPQRLYVDDAQTDEDGWSNAKRIKTIEYFFSTMTNMVMPDGQIGVVGTAMHTEDLLSQLRRNPSYANYKYPSEDKNGESTWPDVYSNDFLRKLKTEIGSVRYARERLCEPVSDASSLFPRSLFYEHDMMQPMTVLGADEGYWKNLGIRDFYIGVDLALSTSVSADFWVLMVIGVDDMKNRWFVDISRDRGLSFSEQKARVVSFARRYPPAVITIEANAYQAVAANELRRQTDLPIRSFTTTAQKHSLTDGLPSLRLLLENGKLRIPRGDARSVEMTDLLIEEATNFTWVGGKAQSTGGHDDIQMAWYLTEQGIAKGMTGFQVALGPDEAQSRQQPFGRALPDPEQQSAKPVFANSDFVPPAPTGQIVYRNGIPVRV
jgi:hypothetical protein